MAINRVPRVAFGTLRAATDIEPRQSILSQAPQALETAAQKQQQAAITQFRAAGAVGDVTREVAAMGVQYLKPMDALVKSRQVLEANNVAIDAILEGRRMADAAKKDGTPHTEYIDTVGTGWDRISTNALYKVRHLGPAAVSHVSEALGGEKIRQYTQAQQFYFERETGEQKGFLHKIDTTLRRDITTTASPAERVAIQAQYDLAFDTAADQGVITRTDAEKSKNAFHLHTVEATAIQIGRASKSIPDVMRFLKSANLTPQQVKDFENAAYDAMWYDLNQADRAEKAALKEITKAQEYLSYTYAARINSATATPPQMEALRLEVRSSAEEGDLVGDQARQVDFWARDRIKELENPLPMRDNEDSYQKAVQRIQNDPTTTPNDLQNLPGLTASTRQTLFNQLLESRQKNHFMQHPYYQAKLAELDGLAGEDTTPDDPAAKMERAIKNNADPNAALEEGLRARIRQAKTGYLEILLEDTKATHGIATYDQIKARDGYIEAWKEQLRAPVKARPKPKPAVGNEAVNEFNTLKNEPKATK